MSKNQKDKTAKPTLELKGAYKQYKFYENQDAPFATIGGEFHQFGLPTYNSNNQAIMKHLKTSKNQQRSPKHQKEQSHHSLLESVRKPVGENAQQNQMMINCQPLFFDIDEVDHNIEEIGLMAVREVRYVDDDEWEEMMREQQKYAEAIKKNIREDMRKSRKIEAQKRKRNDKGQFLPKQKKLPNLNQQDKKFPVPKHKTSQRPKTNKNPIQNPDFFENSSNKY